jgi:hypothetical protein|nr:MAG TPA_asm: hypothetical protein [Caudoviricetes sp.]
MAEAKKPATKAAKKDKAFQIKVVFQGSVRVHSRPILGDEDVLRLAKTGEMLTARAVDRSTATPFYELVDGGYIAADPALVVKV